jgi:transglycosylase-like protein
MRFRTPILAALAAVLAAAPVGVVLAADAPAPHRPLVSPTLRAPLAGDAAAAEAMRGHVVDRLVREHVRLAARHADLSGRRVIPAAAGRRAHAMEPSALRRANVALRAEVRELDVPIPPVMWKIAQCESHGDPRAIGGDGAFRGALQFMRSTWESVGGEGDPAAAPMEEQLRRGAVLMARSGSSPWPVCAG